MPTRNSILLTTTLTLLILFLGCASDSNTQPTTRASNPLSDPFGKWSTMDNVDMDISGGTTSELKKDSFKRDIDRTLLLK
jgi:hypothetical protein